jgi:DNA-binding transcriptional regulator PaaX
MPKKQDFSRKILKILSEKPAISVTEISNQVNTDDSSKKGLYSITRSLKGLKSAGYIENISSGQNDYARLTKSGRVKANSYKLEAKSSLVNTSWDGKWRIILLDLPENRKSERESLRYLLKKAGFVCLKNSVWVSPFPFEYMFGNIKKDLGLSTELMIITTNSIDPETEEEFMKMFKK